MNAIFLQLVEELLTDASSSGTRRLDLCSTLLILDLRFAPFNGILLRRRFFLPMGLHATSFAFGSILPWLK
jgi:hypothetical protein